MTLARELSAFVHRLRLEDVGAGTVSSAKTLVLDALACMVAGAEADGARIALSGLGLIAPGGRGEGPGPASGGVTTAASATRGAASTVVVHGLATDPAAAALVNGAMLRSLDLMDTYVSLDVCHPSEIVPAALACAKANRATGSEFLAATIAGLSLHQALADTIALHRHGLHHAGQAAWTVPLVAGRLLAASASDAARALTISAHRLLMPESFARGQLTNFKAMAYPLLAREAIEAVRFAQAGLTGSAAACEETIALLVKQFGMSIDVACLVPRLPLDLSTITLKMYPAQYALQPLIASACKAHAAGQGAARGIERVVVHASKRTVERTADRAKYTPSGPEAADHSLPFCLAVALMDGCFAPQALHSGRWADRETLALMEKVVALPVESTTGYEVGRQEIELRFEDGTTATLSCRYPPEGVTPWSIAERKLREASSGRLDADAILDVILRIEHEPDLERLVGALAGTDHRRQQAKPAGLLG